MPFPQQSYITERYSDGQLIERFYALASAFSGMQFSVSSQLFLDKNPREYSEEQFRSDEDLNTLRQADERTIASIHGSAGKMVTVHLDREGENSFRVKIDIPKTTKLSDFIETLKKVKEHFKDYGNEAPLKKVLEERAKDDLLARDQMLTRMQGLQEDFIRKGQSFVEELANRAIKAQAKMDEAYQARIVQLDTQNAEKEKAFAEKEAAFSEKLKNFNLNESKYVRRDLKESILNRLGMRSQEFELTTGTNDKRYTVLKGYVTAIVASAIVFGTSWIPQQGMTDSAIYILLGIRGLGLVFLALTFGLFIKWLNNWFRVHADEEFRQKRLEIDIIRASWVVELVMEYQDKGKEIPEFVVGTLSRNLFFEPNGHEHPLTAADMVASFLTSSANIKLKFGDSEVYLDKKGAQGLEKKKIE